MNDKPQQRNRLLIKKEFQVRLIIGVFAIILLSGLCSALLVYWIAGDDLQAQSLSAHVSIVNAEQRLGLSILISNVVSILVAGSITVISVLYVSHRIAGPLYRFESLCEQVGNGNFDTITQLREQDQFQELAKSFSTMVAKLRDGRDRRARLIAELNHHLGLCIINGGDNLSDEQQNIKATLATLLAELEKLDDRRA